MKTKKARQGRAVVFDEIDEEFMQDYGISPEQMRFFKAAYRRELTFKIVIGVLVVLLGIGYAMYRAVM